MAGEASDVVLGYECDVEINGTAFGVVTGRIRTYADPQETGDTLSGPNKLHKGGRGAMEVSLTFYNKFAVNPHAAPLGIKEGTYIPIKIYTQGSGDANDYETDYLLVTEFSTDFSVDGKGQGSISGVSSGTYVKRGSITRV